MSKIIYSGTPKLPYTFDYTPDGDSPEMLFFSGSAWTSTTDSKIGLKLSIDGTEVATASIFSNGPTTHRALTPALSIFTFPVIITGGAIAPVRIKIEAIAGTLFDKNDSVTVATL